MKPSLAAATLLSNISLPDGVAVVWPVTRSGKIMLVVKLDDRYWEQSKLIPVEFEGFEVIVEPNKALPAQISIKKYALGSPYISIR